MAEYKDINDYEVMYMIQENDENAKNLMYEKYKPIVLSTASKYYKQAKSCGLELEDLVQEGYFGIYNAIKYYRSDMNIKFYTYVIISIRSKILNCLKKENSSKAKALNTSISLYDELIPEEDKTFLDIVENKKALLPEVEIENDEIISLMKDFMYSLNFDRSLIFELKLNGFSQREISKLLGISVGLVNKYWLESKNHFLKSYNLLSLL